MDYDKLYKANELKRDIEALEKELTSLKRLISKNEGKGVSVVLSNDLNFSVDNCFVPKVSDFVLTLYSEKLDALDKEFSEL